jgi:predicted helicase
MTERLGIVYTPVEVVDFIIHSINDLLQQEFGQTLGSKGVHILDPFTGTGTFITRLLQSGLIAPQELPHKYRHEIHANEIVLLAYYIAAINIEAVYHEQRLGHLSDGQGARRRLRALPRHLPHRQLPDGRARGPHQRPARREQRPAHAAEGA